MGYLFSAPLIVGVIVFAIYPMFAALFMSFHQTSGLNLSGTWVGLSNYQYALEDSIFWQALSNTFVMGIWSVLLGIALSFVLASLINNLKWHLGRNFSKRYIFCPMSCQALLQACCSPSCFPSKEGLINFVIGLFGFDPVGWFTNPEVARYSIVLMSLWGALGYNTIIFLAGLQSVRGIFMKRRGGWGRHLPEMVVHYDSILASNLCVHAHHGNHRRNEAVYGCMVNRRNRW